MGKNLEEITAGLVEGDMVKVRLVTNQDNGHVGYAEGSLTLEPESGGHVNAGGSNSQPRRLSTARRGPLPFSFNIRKRDIGPDASGKFLTQPFDAGKSDRLGITIPIGANPTALVTFLDGPAKNTQMIMESRGNLLVGLGPSVGGSPNAVYVVSFIGVTKNPIVVIPPVPIPPIGLPPVD